MPSNTQTSEPGPTLVEYDLVKYPPTPKVEKESNERVCKISFVKGNSLIYEQVSQHVYHRCTKEYWHRKFDHVFRCTKDPETGIITSVSVRKRETDVKKDTASQADIIVFLTEDGNVSYNLQSSSAVVNTNIVENWFREHKDVRIKSGTRVGQNLVITNITDMNGIAEYHLSVG